MANDPKFTSIHGGLSKTPAVAPGTSPSGLRRTFLRDLVLPCSIGVYRHEKDAPQRVRINLDLAVRDDGALLHDDVANVVDYSTVADAVRAIVADGHVNLVETLAERIAAHCLRDQRVVSVQVQVEKLDVFTDAASAGVEIVRQRLP